MAEAGVIRNGAGRASGGAKSYNEIANQRDRILRQIGNTNPARTTNVLRTSQRYLRNIEESPEYRDSVRDYLRMAEAYERAGREPVGMNPAQAMAAYREARADLDASRWAINAMPYPRSVYMRRRNNR